MKIKRFIAAALLAAASLASYAAVPKVSVDANGVSVREVLEQIKDKTGYEVFYNDKHVDTKRIVNVRANNQELDKVLDELFKGTNTSYTIQNKRVILSVASAPAETKTAQKEPQNPNTPGRVSGTVTGADGEPLIGVTVREHGTKNATITNIDGEYTLRVDSSNPTIEFSYVGFKPKSAKAKAGTTFDAVMTEDSNILDEVVVVGYGTMKKRDLTGSVSQVKMSESTAATVGSVSNALAGKAAGLQVTVANSQPGAASTFRVRGAASPGCSNDPLIIIDGFPVNPTSDVGGGMYDSGTNDNVLGSLNPNDIESIEVLKDASSTAIYGARAGHGVIIVTTKRGKAGKPKVTYSGTVAMQKIAKNYDVLDANDFMAQVERFRMEKWRIDNYVGIYGGEDEAAMMLKNPYRPKFSAEDIATPHETTDWLGAITRTGMQTQHNLSITGGTDYTRYMISGNFFLQNGIIRNNDLNRFTLRTNIDQKFNDHFSGGLNLTFSRIDQDNISSGANFNESSSLMVSAVQANPLAPIYDGQGNYYQDPEKPYTPNAVSLLDITNKYSRERFLGSAYVEYKPIETLTFKANFGIDRNYAKRKVYLPTTTLYGKKANGQADIGTRDQNDYLVELTGSFNKVFNVDHNFSAVAGWSYQKFVKEGFTGGNSDFLTDALLYNSLGFGQYERPWVGSSASNDEMMSAFARVNYSYKGRYLLTATMRADGCSYFAKGHQWGYFPSVALGWRFSDEPFLAQAHNWLSNGKLRVSWGQTGNSSIGYQSISLYSNKDAWHDYMMDFGGNKHLGFMLTQLGNPNITWETTTEWNFGLDLGFVNNRINLNADFFMREISDLLNWRPLPHTAEVLSIADNIGSTKSHGLELTLNTVNITNRDFEWTSDLTFSFYRDRWKERAEGWVPSAYSQYDGYIRQYAGFFVYDGLVQPGEENSISFMPNALPGQVKVKDINGYTYNPDGTFVTDEHGIPVLTGKPDGKIDDADRIIVGSMDPGFIMGFNNTLRWKNFDFNIYFYGHFNQWMGGNYKQLWIGSFSQIENGRQMPLSFKDIWSTDNPDGIYPGFAQVYNTKFDAGATTMFMKKCWFVRCRNITLGYRVPTGKALSNLRVYLDVNNPFLISNYKGLDMETDDSAWAIPNVRTYSFGVELTF